MTDGNNHLNLFFAKNHKKEITELTFTSTKLTLYIISSELCSQKPN